MTLSNGEATYLMRLQAGRRLPMAVSLLMTHQDYVKVSLSLSLFLFLFLSLFSLSLSFGYPFFDSNMAADDFQEVFFVNCEFMS